MHAPRVTLSNGMGVDTTALQLRWIFEPQTRDFDLRKDLVVVTAMTGNENPQTGEYMERYMLPLLAEHGIRYVQLSRAGQLKRDGYEILSDNRETERMVMEGSWRLDYELRSVGTTPSVQNGRRWCSLRAKGDPIDWWVADNCEPGYTHVMGYAAEERRRAEKDTRIRAEKLEKGEAIACVASYPLIGWRWDRQRCEEYISEKLGEIYKRTIRWPRSCCVYCPFQETAGSRDELAARWRANPSGGAEALVLEYTSLALNPRIGLFGVEKTARDFAIKYELKEVIKLADQRIYGAPKWSLVEVRRVFDARKHNPLGKGRAWRSIRVVAEGTQAEMMAALCVFPDADVVTDPRGFTRAWREKLPATDVLYPASEWYRCIVPAGVQNKEMPGFAKVWARAHAPTLF